jgi:hypothetical protein
MRKSKRSRRKATKSRITLSPSEKKIAAEMRRMIAKQKQSKAAAQREAVAIRKRGKQLLAKLRKQREAIKLRERVEKEKTTKRVAKLLKIKLPPKLAPKYFRTQEFWKTVKGVKRRFVGVFEHRKGQKGVEGKLISSRRVTEFAEVGKPIKNDGRIYDATDKIAPAIHALPWPLIVRATVRGTMGGKQVVMTSSVVLRRNNPLYKNKAGNKEQQIELVSYFLGQSLLRKIRSLAANPSSKKHRSKAQGGNRKAKSYDIYADPSRLHVESVSFEVAG